MISSNPFPGLRPFEATENHLFFGRDGQSDEILTSLRRNRFVAVVGTSGSGKSSLIRAGLLPSLHGGFMAQTSSSWKTAICRPGSDPIGNLAAALSEPEILGTETAEPETRNLLMEMTLRRSALGLIEAVRQARIPAQTNLLIVVDQFEELFRFRSSANAEASEDDATFVKLLIEATRQNEAPIYVVITMRSDFIGDCARFRELPETINRGLYLIPVMTRDQRREAITGPAAVAGAEISPPLINRLLNDVGDNPDQLPILQHALMRTWDYRSEHHTDHEPIDLGHYEAVGGLAEALSRHADEAYEELPTQRSKMIAEKVFKALAEKRPDNREVRRPTTVAGLCAIADASEGEVIAVIENFRRAGRSFLTPAVGIDLHADSMIDISHESLIRGWQRLRDWVEAEALSAGIYRRVAETAALYEKGDAGLWNDPDLQVALGWQRSVNPNQAWGERYHPGFPAAMNFLNESVAARDREFLEQEGQRVKELRRIRVFAAVLAVALILASALGVWAMTQRSRANQEAENARKEKQKAEAAKDEAEQARVAAVRSEGEAKKRRQEAEASKTLAEQRKREAEANLIAANAAKRTADENADAARKQKDIAEERNRKFISAVGNAEKQNQEDMGLLTSLYTELIARSSSQDSIKWRTWRAAALTSQGRHSEAEADLTKVLEATPDYDEARMTRGYMYMLTHRVPESIPDFDQVIANDPTSALAYLNRGLSEGIMGKYSDASSSIDNAIKNFRPGTYGSLSETQVSPAITRATGYRRIAADENSFQTALHYELGNIQAFTGRDDFVPLLQIDKSKSLSAYLTAINWAWLHMSIRDRDYGGWVSQGVMWEGLGPVYCGEAAFAYEQFQKNYSEHPDSRYQALSVLANRRKAGLHCPAAVPLPTDDLEALSLKADLAYDQNQYEEAERFLTKALALDKTNVDLLLRRAAARNILKKFADSKADADAVIGQVGDHPKALLYRALASDDTDVVESNLRQVLKDHPTNSDALFWLSKTLEEKNPNEAILLLDRATRLQPYSNALYFRKAHLQEKKGRYREALQSIERAITIDPYNTQYYDARASIEQHLAISPVQIARNLVEGYNQVADLLLKRGEAGPALDSYARSLKLIAVTAKSSGGGDAQCEMAEILHKIARLLEQQGASRDKTIKDLRFMFGDVKELESVLNAEVNALTKSP